MNIESSFTVRPSAEAARNTLSRKLQHFSLDNAHCYNPNDEHKIRAAIEASSHGRKGFEKLIHEIGTQMEKGRVGAFDSSRW